MMRNGESLAFSLHMCLSVKSVPLVRKLVLSSCLIAVRTTD